MLRCFSVFISKGAITTSASNTLFPATLNAVSPSRLPGTLVGCSWQLGSISVFFQQRMTPYSSHVSVAVFQWFKVCRHSTRSAESKPVLFHSPAILVLPRAAHHYPFVVRNAISPLNIRIECVRPLYHRTPLVQV